MKQIYQVPPFSPPWSYDSGQNPENPVCNQTDQSDQNQSCKNSIRCQISLRFQDHISQSIACCDHFCNHKIGLCPSDGQSEIIHKTRKRCRENNLFINLPFAGTQRFCRIYHVSVYTGYRIAYLPEVLRSQTRSSLLKLWLWIPSSLPTANRLSPSL